MFYRLYVRTPASGMLQIGRKLEKGNGVTISRHDNFIFLEVVLFLLSSLVTGPSFMSISSLVLKLCQFLFIRDSPEWGLTSIWYATSIVRMRIFAAAILQYFASESWSQGDWFFWLICRSNLTINIVSPAKKMRNEWLTMPTRKTFFFIPSFHLASSLLMKQLKLTHMIKTKGWERIYIKIWSWETCWLLWNKWR